MQSISKPASVISQSFYCLLAVFSLWGQSLYADEALVAVASNFIETAERLAEAFAANNGDTVVITSGSTGKLYAQVMHGAPYDVLLAADQERPRLLVQAGAAVDQSVFTYAIGRVALWSPVPDAVSDNGLETLRGGEFRKLAIANPSLAPYGVAAKEILQASAMWDLLENRIAMGENVGQAFTLVATGNAEFGLVALSQVMSRKNRQTGSRWVVPASTHAPIRQDAALLVHGSDNSAARGFLHFLRSDAARNTIRSSGYDVE